MDEILTFFFGVAEKLARLYTTKQISIGDFQLEFRDMLRAVFTAMLISGEGGKNPRDIDSKKFLQLGTVLRKQYRFLERFMRQAASGSLSDKQIISRALMYVNAASQMYWHGISDVKLPAYPRDGSSVCLMNCKCEWEIDYRVDGSGKKTHLLATWVLHPAEHCSTCLERAAVWNPLVIPLR